MNLSLYISVDNNGTPRMFRRTKDHPEDEYLGVASGRELELWEEIKRLRFEAKPLNERIGADCILCKQLKPLSRLEWTGKGFKCVMACGS